MPHAPGSIPSVPHTSMPNAPRTNPHITATPTDLTCTCTTYAGTTQTCISCRLRTTFFDPYPRLRRTTTYPMVKRRNFTKPSPMQGKFV